MGERSRWCMVGVLAGLLIIGAGAALLEAQPPENEWSRLDLTVDWNGEGPVRAKRWESVGAMLMRIAQQPPVAGARSLICRGRLFNGGQGAPRVKVRVETSSPTGQLLDRVDTKTNRNGDFFVVAEELQNTTRFAQDLINGTLIRTRLSGRNRRPITKASVECVHHAGTPCQDLPTTICVQDRFRLQVAGDEPWDVFNRTTRGGVFTNFRSDVFVDVVNRCSTDGNHWLQAGVRGPDTVNVMATDVLTGDMGSVDVGPGDDILVPITHCP